MKSNRRIQKGKMVKGINKHEFNPKEIRDFNYDSVQNRDLINHSVNSLYQSDSKVKVCPEISVNTKTSLNYYPQASNSQGREHIVFPIQLDDSKQDVYNSSTDNMIMTGHGFTSTYTPFRNESKCSKDNDPYSINYKVRDRNMSHHSRKKNSIIQNMAILDSKSRSDITSSHRRTNDEAKASKLKTTNWLFRKILVEGMGIKRKNALSSSRSLLDMIKEIAVEILKSKVTNFVRKDTI